MAEACLVLLVVALVAYAVFGGADYGAGLWDLTAGGPRRGGRIRGLIVVVMTPVWEANHVWLPFIAVILWTAFPIFFASIMSTLYVPLLIAMVGIIIRGSAFVLRGHAVTLSEGRMFGGLFAISSVLTPFMFGAAIGAIASGRVPVGNAGGELFGSWLTPTSIALGVLAVATSADLAAVFLAADAERLGLPDLVNAMRRRALGMGVIAGVLALATLLVLHGDARHLFDKLTSGLGLACVLASAACGVITLALVADRRLHLARYSASGAVTFVLVGWVVAQSPYLVPNTLTLHAAAAGESTLLAVLVSFAGGALLLVPSLALLYRMSLQGRLDKPYEPLDAPLRKRAAT
jgi:cytochrome d ubiquinol oxidase subunit II